MLIIMLALYAQAYLVPPFVDFEVVFSSEVTLTVVSMLSSNHLNRMQDDYNYEMIIIK